MKAEFYIGFIILALLLFLPLTAIASGKMARGAVPGELYVYGVGDTLPWWEDWLYRSVDSGQTIYLQNDTVGVTQLAEGGELGVLYKVRDGYLSCSDNFGVDFMFKEYLGFGLDDIAGGSAPGEVYAYLSKAKHSLDYGDTFVDKGICPGYVTCMSVGHSPGEIYIGCMFGEVYYSHDYGETYDLIVDSVDIIYLRYISRGSIADEIYFLGSDNWLYYSPNRGDSLYQRQYFNIDFEYLTGITGGFFSGEVYVLQSEHFMMGGGELYIHRSTDYGQTFTVYHVYSTQEDVLPPHAIDNLTCAPSDSSILLDWWPVNQDIWGQPETISHYVVYRSTDPYFIPTTGDSIGFCTDSYCFDINSRWATPAYYYMVKAVDDSGNKSKASNRTGRFNRELTNW
jgi:hypothetical protein